MAIRKILTRAIDSTASSSNLNIDANTLFIDATNNRVGIGSASPASKLVVNGASGAVALNVTNVSVDGSTADVVQIEPSNGAYYGKLLKITSGRSDYSDALLFLNTSTGMNGTNGSYLRVQNSSSADIFRIKGDGTVGIGVTAPVNKLEVNGAIVATGAAAGYSANMTIIDVGSGLSNITAIGSNTSTVGTTVFQSFSSNASVGGERMRISSTGNVGIGTTSPTARLESYTTTLSQSALVATSTYPANGGKAVQVTVGNNNSNSGGYGVYVTDKTDNGGGAQVGYGVYTGAPYDGTNASGGTYALSKYGLYVDDLYSYYGLNSTNSNYNTGIYIKGGGRNYIKAPLTLDGQLVINSNLIVTGITYTSGFYFNGGGTQNILTIYAGEAYLFYSVYASYGPGDHRHGVYYLAAVSSQTSSGVQLAALGGSSGFTISGGVVSYSAGGGNPTTTIWWQKLSG